LPALTLSWVQHLIADNPDGAVAELADWPSVPSRTRWRIQDTNALAARADIAVYRGDPRRAWTLMDEYWPSVTRSLMVRVITIRVLLLLTRAKCAVTLALTNDVDNAERARLLRAAEHAAQSMERTRCGWALAFAVAIRASIASCRGQHDEARRLLERAAADLQAFELMPWYYAARWQLGGYQEQATGTAVALDDWWITERIVQPHRVAHLLIPGAWPARRIHVNKVAP